MANQVIVTNTGNVQVALTPPANVQVQISRAAIGTVSNVPTANFANYAGNVTVSNQPNITGLGTLSNLTVSGNTTLNNLLVTGNLIAGNLSANYANFAGQVVDATQSNITSVGTLSSLSVSGNISAPIVYNQGMVTQGYDFVQMQYSNGAALPVSPYDLGTGSWFYLDAGGATWQSNTTGTFKEIVLGNNGNLSASGNITGANANLGNLVTANYFSGNGSLLTDINGGNVSNVANANYANFAGTAYSVSGANVSGEVANANYATYAGNATFATDAGNANIANIAYSVDVANVVGIGNIAILNLDGNVSNILHGDGSFGPEAGNLSANYANFAGQVVDNTQSNITALGTLSNLSVTGNIETSNNVTALKYYAATGGDEFSGYGFVGASNSNTAMCMTSTDEITIYNNAIETLALYANNNAKFYANLTANYYFGDGSQLSNINGANVSGQVGNALVAGTVYTNAQPNITSLGNLTALTVSGDAGIAGNLTVGGNISYVNVNNLVVQDPVIELGGGPNGAPLTTNDGKDRGTLLHYYTTQPIDAFMGWDNGNGEFAFGSNVTNNLDVMTFNTLGNVRAQTFIGNLTGLASSATVAASANAVAGANVSGTVANANYSAYSGVAGVANSVAVANVSGLGNIATTNYDGNAGNVLYGNGGFYALPTVSNVANANYANFAGTAYNVSGSNVSGEVANANYSTYSGTAGSANSVAGANVTGAVGLANFATTANAVAGANVTGAVAYATTANSVAVANVVGIGNIATTNFNGNGSQALLGNGVFGAVSSTTVAGSNTQIQYNNNGNLGANSYFTFDTPTTTLNVGSSTDQVYPGTINVKAKGVIGSSTGTVAITPNSISRTTAFSFPANANISGFNVISYGAGPNNITLTSDGNATIGNNFTVTGNANVGNLGTTRVIATGNISATQLISNISTGNAPFIVTSTTQVANLNAATAGLATFATTANAVAGANVSGAVAFATTANSVALANVSGAGNIASINLDGSSSNVLYGNGVFAAGGGGGGTPGGSNTELQFNNAGSFGGISTVTWNGSNISLGAVGNVKVTGGVNNEVMRTDGTGNLSFISIAQNLLVGTRAGPYTVPITNYTFQVTTRSSGNVTVYVN
jgi:hypothetical protein